jgi:phage shock protein E
MDLMPVAIGGVIATVVWLWMRHDRPSVEVVAKAVADGAVLVDVRSADEFASGHLAGAVNLPLGNLVHDSAALPKDGVIVVYCRSGTRSAMAARQLRKAGFASVLDLGSASRWPQRRVAPEDFSEPPPAPPA